LFAAEPAEVVIRPTGGSGTLLRDLWVYRELLYFLTWRDVKVRYKQAALGVAWAVLQPLVTMAVFTLFLGRLAGLREQTGGVPYSVFVLAGLVPWTFFANAITAASNSVVGSQHLVTKVYFPRLIIPLATVGAGLVDFAIALGLLAVVLAWNGIAPNLLGLALLPVMLGLLALAAVGVGTLLCALTVAYRDVRFIVPFLVQVGLFVTPVVYPATLLPERWQWVLALNPMAGLIVGFRACLWGGWDVGTVAACVVSGASAVALFTLGAWYFQRVEQRFADII
jgi:lipopolysaccharide transport system permease protein